MFHVRWQYLHQMVMWVMWTNPWYNFICKELKNIAVTNMIHDLFLEKQHGDTWNIRWITSTFLATWIWYSNRSCNKKKTVHEIYHCGICISGACFTKGLWAYHSNLKQICVVLTCKNNDQIMPQFCTCHNSSAVVVCVKLGMIGSIELKWKSNDFS